MRFRYILCLFGIFWGASLSHAKISITGSSALARVMESIVQSFNGDAEYDARDSGAGMKCALDGSCDIGVSDIPIPSKDWMNGTLTIPAMVAGLALAHGVKGVTGIRLKACDLARIYSGKTVAWGDASIVNTQIAGETDLSGGPPIVPIARGDASGTNAVLTQYLSVACPVEWTNGSSQEPNWPPGVKTTKSTDGMIAEVLTTQNSLGYAVIGRFPANMEVAIEDPNGMFLTSALPQFGVISGVDLPKTNENWGDVNFIFKENTYPTTFVGYLLVQLNQATPELVDFIEHLLSLDVQLGLADYGFRGLTENLRSVSAEAALLLRAKVLELKVNGDG